MTLHTWGLHATACLAATAGSHVRQGSNIARMPLRPDTCRAEAIGLLAGWSKASTVLQP